LIGLKEVQRDDNGRDFDIELYQSRVLALRLWLIGDCDTEDILADNSIWNQDLCLLICRQPRRM
jgi:hypothetical protein